ncbi:MAG: arginine--tRNA ligase, partial [Pseudomonadota bacterium]
YGGPNVAKPMHVGHLRATIIGDSIKRLFRHAGYEAIGDIHMGDWGLPMGMLISEIAERRPDLPYFDPDAIAFPTEPPVSLDDLVELYPQAAAACKESEQRAESARLATAELQSGRAGYRALWRHFIDLSVAALKQDFGELGVAFELWKGEADVDPLLAPMVEDLRRKGIAEKSDGAIIVQVTEPEDKTDIPPLILLKSDRSANYATTDVATIVDRMNSYSPVAMLYVVDQRQALHFEQVFRTVRRGALVAEDTLLEFVGFGTMNGPDGKPFRTRAGGVMRLADLIGMAVERARDRLAQEGLGQDYPQEEQEQIAHRVGIAALKFADLQSHRQTNYVFDIDRFTAFEGKTGPYLLYAAVRIKSLLKRAGDQGLSEGPVQPMQGQDAALAMVLGEFPSAFASALDKRAPSELCDHAYQLCQAFSRFYAECHILSESDARRQSGWLRLSSLTLRQLETTLNLLGIEVPDRM